jgi:hypothetical protein
MYWDTLRKTTTIVIVEREHTHDKLFAENIRVRVDDDAPMLDVSVDLEKNLRTRAKGVGTYIDAMQLAEHLAAGRTSDFKSVTIDDRGVLDRLQRILQCMKGDPPDVWRLHVALRGDYWFVVRPEYRHTHAYKSLTFRVQLDPKKVRNCRSTALSETTMRIDTYTKFILTVIALCLLWLSVGGPAMLPIARAQVIERRTGEPVILSGWTDDRGFVHSFPQKKGAQGNGLPVTVVDNFAR